MKNKLITFIAAFCVAACTALSGCSCAGDKTLSFSSAFSGGSAPTTATYTETLEYKVEYSENYLANSKKDAGLDKYATFEFTGGTYRSDFAIATGAELAEIAGDVKTDERVNTVYRITTEFSVELKILTLNGETVDFAHTETITTKAFIASAGAAFAPLYAEETAEYCIVSVADKAKAYIIESENKTLYDTDKYTKTLKYREYGINETPDSENSVSADKEKTVKYDFLTAIDNAEFIFALRGINLNEEKASKTVPVVSPNYDEPTPLKITNTSIADEQFAINYVKDGVPAVINQKIKYNTFEYHIDKTNAAGQSQYINVQADKAGDLPNLALPLKFAKPLITYGGGSIVSMGSLVFTLTDVIINN
ncbi:MAG: hypothetical protein J6Y43_04095 [Clostridia bacterium]|nr:hypothetical protein [Clostridia bacterium]